MRSLPASLLQALLRAGTDVMRRCHPHVFERLGALDGTLILIDPIDLPICLAIEFVAGDHRFRAACAEDKARASTIVRGPLLVLIDLVEGRRDGDADSAARLSSRAAERDIERIRRAGFVGSALDEIEVSARYPTSRFPAALSLKAILRSGFYRRTNSDDRSTPPTKSSLPALYPDCGRGRPRESRGLLDRPPLTNVSISTSSSPYFWASAEVFPGPWSSV